MFDELQNLAQSQNVALLLSLIGNVILGFAVARLFRKLEESVSAKDKILRKLATRLLEERGNDPNAQRPVEPRGV